MKKIAKKEIVFPQSLFFTFLLS